MELLSVKPDFNPTFGENIETRSTILPRVQTLLTLQLPWKIRRLPTILRQLPRILGIVEAHFGTFTVAASGVAAAASAASIHTLSVSPNDIEAKVQSNKNRKINSRSPMDCFVSHSEEPTSKRMKKQKCVNDEALKVFRGQARSAIARWIYEDNFAYNSMNYDNSPEITEVIEKHGPGMKASIFHEVRVPLFKNEVDRVNMEMEDHKGSWKINGCSIILERRNDNKGQMFLNFLVNCDKGSMFVKSVNTSCYCNSGQKIFDLLSEFVEQVGPENVVQVVTNNTSDMKLAGQLLMEKYPNLYWTPCVSHCLNLMLDDICKEKDIRPIFVKAMKLNNYFFSRPGVVKLMRKFTKLELVKPATTHFATSFLALSRLNRMKKGLRAMFISDAWRNSKWAKELSGIQAYEIVLYASFWRGVIKALKIGGPLVNIHQLVDHEKKSHMGYIYEAMSRAKEAIAKSFDNDKVKYRRYFEIIDKRWEYHPLHAAGYYLNPEFFYSNPNIECDAEILSGFYKCLEKLVPDTNIQDLIRDDLTAYRKADDLFGRNLAKSSKSRVSPDIWWSFFGLGNLNLQRLAMKILSLTSCASRWDNYRSFFEPVRSKKRNRMNRAELNDLVFVKYNRALRQRDTTLSYRDYNNEGDEEKCEPISYEEDDLEFGSSGNDEDIYG